MYAYVLVETLYFTVNLFITLKLKILKWTFMFVF